MFTVKQIIKDKSDPSRSRDSIKLWEAKDVYLVNREITPEDGTERYMKLEVNFNMPDGVLASLDSGVIFVMNTNGKTVETFRLAGSEWF